MKVVSLQEEHHSCISHRCALSSLQALTNTKLPHLAKTLQLLSNNCRVAFQWILTHCDFSGNEQADKLAKEGATVSYQQRQLLSKQL